jgi:Nucleotidyl transferase AbiEii toxin, Type IV TA system
MLREDTGRLWDALRTRPELKGFVLIGGSGLALQIGHRRSEDLDFAWPHGNLPRGALRRLVTTASGITFVPDDDEIAKQEADDCSLDLGDIMQNYLADGVRVTFFKSERAEASLLGGTPADPLRIATVPEIFLLKALVTAKRSKSRDWFDLYILFQRHGYKWTDYHDAFMRHGLAHEYGNASSRLCSGQPQRDDEGYKNLVDDPPKLEEMRDYFISLRTDFEEKSGEKGG